jgi:hypothetical protein
MLLANHIKFYPRILLSLTGLVIAIVAFETLGNWLASGKDLAEPDRSLSIFKKRLFRVNSDVQIEGVTRPVANATELMTYADIARTPIVHLVLHSGQRHQFFVVTDDINYVFEVDLEKIANKKPKHKK